MRALRLVGTGRSSTGGPAGVVRERCRVGEHPNQLLEKEWVPPRPGQEQVDPTLRRNAVRCQQLTGEGLSIVSHQWLQAELEAAFRLAEQLVPQLLELGSSRSE